MEPLRLARRLFRWLADRREHCPAEVTGRFGRMARLAYDPERETTWLAYLRVDLRAREVETRHGPTRVTEARDAVVVRPHAGGPSVDVSAGSRGARLAPSIAARDGRVCVAWCACEPDSRRWRVWVARSEDGRRWSPPEALTAADGDALHPSVALAPDTGEVWLAYEDWSDGSIRLVRFGDNGWSRPRTVSRGGRNFRPRMIVTARRGKHRGAVAVAWDAYRERQYDIYLRVLGSDLRWGPEQRATRCARWDSCADLAEDLDGNLWVAWVRASNELGETSAMRNVHVRFFDGEQWRYPHPPERRYRRRGMALAALTSGLRPPADAARRAYRAEHPAEDRDGRLTWYEVNWFPRLHVDARNRVYVFYREGDRVYPPILGHLGYRVYAGSRWSEPRRLDLGRRGDVLRMIHDFSVAITSKGRIEAVWDQVRLTPGGEVLQIRSARPRRLKGLAGPRERVEGESYPETLHPGWPERSTLEPRPAITWNGERFTLLYGDIHNHSWLSIGVDPPDYHFHFARDFAKLDYFALPENDYLFCGTPGTEAFSAFLPKRFDAPEFICCQAHEFVSSAMGHRVMLFEGHDKPLIPHGMLNSFAPGRANTTAHLYAFLHEYCEGPAERVVVCCHNMTRLGNDFRDFDPSLEPVYDVASVHFGAERTHDEYRARGVRRGANLFLDALLDLSLLLRGDRAARQPSRGWYRSWCQCLDAGLPLGVHGSSDNHSSNGLGWVVAGLWVREPSKAAIFDALLARRSLALDNQLRLTDMFDTDPVSPRRRPEPAVVRASLWFAVDDTPMGQSCRLEAAPTARVTASCQPGHDQIETVTFVKDGRDTHVERVGGEHHHDARWRDDAWRPGGHYYYARVELRSGTLVVSSPVLVDFY